MISAHIFVKSILALGLIFNCISQTYGAEVRVGIMNSEGLLNREEITNDFLNIVKKSLSHNESMAVYILPPRELSKKIREGKIDIFFANSIFYRAQLPFGAKDIATVHSEWNPNPNSADGAAVFVKRSNDQVNTISDLQNRSVAVSSTSSPDSWYFALGAVKDIGKDTDHFFGRILQTHSNEKSVVNAVINDKVQSGIVPACFLELYVLERPQIFEEIKILDYLKSSELPCTVSTPLYPNWTVAILPSISMKTARLVTKNLLSVPEDPPHAWWAVSTKFDAVDSLLRELRVEQYSYLREWSIGRVMREYGIFLGLFLALFVFLFFYGLFASRLIKERTTQLSQSLKRQNQYQRQYESAQKNLLTIRRMGLLTQASSIIAHELRQPLSAIKCYIHGLERKIENHQANEDSISRILETVDQKVDFADNIIQKVRKFTRNGTQREKCSLSKILNTSIDNFLLGSHNTEKIILDITSDIEIYVDPFEIELIIVNLLRNSSEALANETNPTIWVKEIQKGSTIVLTVEDNGKKLNDNDIRRIYSTTDEPNADGRGIGLKIVQDVVNDMGGNLMFYARKPRGLCVTITLPTQNTYTNEP